MASVTLTLTQELFNRLPKLNPKNPGKHSGMMLLTGNQLTGDPVILDAVVVGPKRAGTLTRKSSMIASSSNGRPIHCVPFTIELGTTVQAKYSRADWMFGSVAQRLHPSFLWQAIRLNQMQTKLYPFSSPLSDKASDAAKVIADNEWVAAGAKEVEWSTGEVVAATKKPEKAKV